MPSRGDNIVLPSGDLAMQARAQLRTISDDSLKQAIEAGGRLAIVAFRMPGADAGVSMQGRNAVTKAMRTVAEDSIIVLAERVVYRFKHIPAIIVRIHDVRELVALRHRPWIDYIEPNAPIARADAVTLTECWSPTAPGYPAAAGDPTSEEVIPWQAIKIRADSVWGSYDGYIASKRLAILEDGVNEESHTPLPPYLPQGNKDLSAIAYAMYDTTNLTWEGSHGTPVFGAAAALANGKGTVGIAPGARVQVDRIGYRTNPYYSDSAVYSNAYIAMAIDNEASQSAVMNFSWSAATTTPSPPGGSYATIIAAIRNAYTEHDVIMVASTGNSEQSNVYRWPAQLPEVVGVGGVSEYGDTAVYNDYASGNVEIAAAAANVVTVCRGGRTGRASGTSFAVPVAAGAFMLLRQAHPTATAGQLRYRVNQTAMSMASFQRSGNGLLNVKAAIEYQYMPATVSVTLQGQPSVVSGISCSWWAVASGGTGDYHYEWTKDGVPVGGDSEELTTGNSGSAFTLEVTVTDGLTSDVETRTIDIEPDAWCQ